ncbi:MAG: redoxin family protein [bacterium]|nr:redoxin family protein [bacterium]
MLGVLVLTATSCKFLAKKIAAMYRDAWDNGLTKREGPIEDGLQTGEWTYYYESGQRRARGRYVDDHRIGPWVYYYETGIVEWRGEFDEKGRRSGEWSMNYPDETLRARGRYVDDSEVGEWEFFFPDGTLQRRGSFDRGRLSGLWRYYRPDGSVKAEGVCHRGQRIGVWRVFDENGREGSKDFGTKPGIRVTDERWPNGNRRRAGVLLGDTPVGCWASWHENGKPRLACTFTKDGKPSGPVTACATDGTPRFTGDVNGSEITSSDGAVALPAPVARAEWLAESEIANASPADLVAGLIGEALAPPNPRDAAAPAAPAGEPALPTAKATAVVEQLANEPERVPAPMQPDWTITEQQELDSYVVRYLDGPGRAKKSRKKYGPPGSKQRRGPGRRQELEGKELPQQVFAGIDGQQLDLRTLRDKKRVLMVILRGFVGEVCVYCVAQTEALAQCQKQLDDLDIEVVVVYPGPRENQESFTKAYEMTFGKGAPPYRIYYDEDLAFVDKLGISGDLAFPTTLVIDRQGKVEYAFVGAHRADRPAAKKLIKLIEGMQQ